MKVCVIDIGTNSIHAIFAEIHATGEFSILGKEKEMVRLGDGSMVSGKLSEESMAFALDTMKRYVALAKNRGMVHIIAVATSAVRESSNGGALVDRIRQDVGIKVRVITGEEEGRLIALAVRNAINFTGKNALIVDIGGGSTEVILMKGPECQWIESLKLGANRLSQLMPLSDPPQKDELDKLEKKIAESLDPALSRLKSKVPDFIVGTSGTLMNLVNMVVSEKGESLPELPRQVMLRYEQIRVTYKHLAALKVAERRKVKGLDARRADMVVHGLAVLVTLMKRSGVERMTVSDKALREGLLYDYIEKNKRRLQIEGRIENLRRRSVVTLATVCDYDSRHAEQTARLSLMLFDQLKDVHDLTESSREILEYAALLHDIGYHVSYDKHHKHTFYLVTNAEMPGFTPEEIQEIAWTARFHRRSVPKKTKTQFGDLPDKVQSRISRLSALLRIADALDHSHFALVRNLKVAIEKDAVTLKIFSAHDVACEIYEAEQRKELFEKVFAKRVLFEIKK
jgi:exopolyphosphatase/guanosine-5'-triphosphate,3'-diphosphate pyrophosphatase